MEIHFCSDKKICEVWLSAQEKKDDSLHRSLQPLYQKNETDGYFTVVYESGCAELYGSVLALLEYNKAVRHLRGGEATRRRYREQRDRNAL